MYTEGRASSCVYGYTFVTGRGGFSYYTSYAVNTIFFSFARCTFLRLYRFFPCKFLYTLSPSIVCTNLGSITQPYIMCLWRRVSTGLVHNYYNFSSKNPLNKYRYVIYLFTTDFLYFIFSLFFFNAPITFCLRIISRNL